MYPWQSNWYQISLPTIKLWKLTVPKPWIGSARPQSRNLYRGILSWGLVQIYTSWSQPSCVIYGVKSRIKVWHWAVRRDIGLHSARVRRPHGHPRIQPRPKKVDKGMRIITYVKAFFRASLTKFKVKHNIIHRKTEFGDLAGQVRQTGKPLSLSIYLF